MLTTAEESGMNWSGLMRPINWAYIHGALPFLHPATHRGVGKRLRRYADLERLSLEENQRLQWEALVKLVVHAYDSSPFYRQRFDSAGVRPADGLSPSDFEKVPVLTRDDIRNHLSELRSNCYRPEELLPAATGGTTDTPVPMLRHPDSLREKIAIQLRFNMWAGFLQGDKVFRLWGARQDFSENPSWRWRLYDRHLMRQVWAPTSLMNERVLESYRQTLNRFRPRIVYAYPTPLALFCEFLRDSGRPYHRAFSAICTAEPLYAHQRRVIEEVLGCPLFEHYGSREFGMIAAECECHQGLHINPAAAYVEYVPVVDSDFSGMREILVTDLLNYGMPLIRYRINDCALPGPEACPCGRGFPLIKRIEGRTTDVFRLPNGDVVPGVALTNRVLQVCPGLKKVQVIQEALEDFRVRFVPGQEFNAADLDVLRRNLKRFFPSDVEWKFERVDDIERERSGKTRFCISKVAPDSRLQVSGHR